jgi:cytochrome c553
MTIATPSRLFRLATTGLALVGLLASAGCARDGAAAPLAGSALYGSCAACHGDSGQGDPTVSAPRIAGLPRWYVQAQLERFQRGQRGEHPDDLEGLRMRAMSRQMMTEAETAAVAQYVADMPPVINAVTRTDTDPAAGQAVFAICATCHGANGEGSEAVNAPPLAGMDDWYFELQLQKFRAGIRGSAPGDTIGPIMRAMSTTVQPDVINDLAAYVHGLPSPPTGGTPQP